MRLTPDTRRNPRFSAAGLLLLLVASCGGTVEGVEGVEGGQGGESGAGEAAVGVHVGSYDRMKETHDAIHAWRAANSRAFAGKSWEIYGDWSDDPAKLETTIVYLLK